MQRLVLVGFANSGKNTVGDHLVEKHGYIGLSYADALKDTLASIFCWDRIALEGVTPESRTWRETVDLWWAKKLDIPHFTPRFAMQNIGTDLFREYFNRDIWIMNAEKRILDMSDQKVVLMDGRFPNEIDLVKRLGGTSIRVKRGAEPSWWQDALMVNSTDKINKAPFLSHLAYLRVHPSEYSWIGHSIDFTLDNDSTVDDLKAKVDDLVR
jgi:hypothetical protein